MSKIFFDDTYIAVIEVSSVKVVCTGHSGLWDYSPKLFAHIDESAVNLLGHPFDPTAPKSIRNSPKSVLLEERGDSLCEPPHPVKYCSPKSVIGNDDIVEYTFKVFLFS